MYTLLIAVASGLLVGGVITTMLGLIGAILPAVVAFGVVYFFVARAVSRRMEQSMRAVQVEFQKQRIDQGLQILQVLKKQYGNWQFFTKSSIDGQIGSIYYMRQDFARAKPFLERGFVRHWVAKVMLAVLYYRKKDYANMDKTFEHVARYNGKQGLLWGVWAYCHWRVGHTDKALQILLRGKKKLGDTDSKLNANLIGLQNEKKMKMKSYGEQWYQFQLEIPQQMRQMRSGNVRFANR